MGTVFKVLRPNGKACAETLTKKQANREIKWQIASGFPGPFTIERGERDGDERWGYSAPRRPGFKWCGAKNLEFLKRYSRGDLIKDLELHFETNGVVICRRAREFGFNKRIDDPRNFEKHRGRWTKREDELINFMYDEPTPRSRIAELHPRSQDAIYVRLLRTAPAFSERYDARRAKRRPGSRHIRPTMEDV